VRDEQNNAGVNEILMPTIQPADIWNESGRYEDYGKEMLRINDRHDRQMLYGPTNEEQVTDIFRRSIKSYKELPQLLYHIQWKFRDELRPRFGVMRGREFLMKDAYSFDIDEMKSEDSYNRFFICYLKTFARLGLKAIPMAADTGPIGGDLSHEFVILSKTGESDIYFDQRILQEDDSINKIHYEGDLKKSVEKFKSYYSVSDDKYNESEFNKNVGKQNQMQSKGIEVGHIFSFGTKYSTSMKANVLDFDGKEKSVYMGSYGIGISRLVGAIIEAKFTNNVMIWPGSVTPFEVAIIPSLQKNDKSNYLKAEKIYKSLIKNKIDVLLDDTEEHLSAKFKKFDLIGIPCQIILGSKTTEDKFEFKEVNGKTETLSLEEIKNKLLNKR
jgi:prolyl-tRNA synthetase